jgi:23S rRNA pseudouridine1911/1915/1917 synthase
MSKPRSRRSSSSPAFQLPRDLVIHITAEQQNQTVSQVLKSQLKEISWNQARRLSTGHRVMIHGNMCADPARRLKEGEVLKVLQQPAGRPPDVADVEIYYLDQHVVVFEKPAGITSIRHAEERGWSKRRRQRQATLDELLPAAIEKQQPRGKAKRREPPPRIRMVHRLDRDTSGVMVAARTVPAEQSLIAQFKQHSTERTYLAICQGHVEAQTIRNHLVRDRGDGLRGSSENKAEGKLAVTHLQPIEHGPGYSLAECRLETGRTHQIRIHLAELGHPVLGEKMYLKRLGQAALRDTSGMPRHALHAAGLAFVHPAGGRQMRFESALPRDMQILLDKLRQQST